MRPLSEAVIKACDPSESLLTRVYSTINFIIPWLLDKGLLESSQDILGFCFNLLVSVIKVSQFHLKAYIIRMIGVLVEAMSALEPQALQYLEFHTQRLNISTDDYESNRLRMARESPMQKSLDWCLKALEPEAVASALAMLNDSLKYGVGLATKVSAAESLAFLAEAYPAFLGTEGAVVFESIINLVVNNPPRYSGLMSSLKSCVRQFAKVVHPEYVSLASAAIIDAYHSKATADEDHNQSIAGVLLQIIGAAADKDVGREFWLKVLLAAYVGSFDPVLKVADAWEKVFQDSIQASCIGDRVSVLSLIAPGSFEVVIKMLEDLSWSRRSQAISTLLGMLSAVNVEKEDSLPPLYIALLKLLPGPIWTGQDRVLDALVTMTIKFPELVDLSLSDETLLVINGEALTISDLFHDSENICVSRSRIESWNICLRGMMKLLFHETRRGDSSYQLAAAVAIATFSRSFNGMANPQVLVDNIDDILAVLQNSASNVSDSSILRPPTPKTPAQRTASDVFGSRYGIDLNSKKPRSSAKSLSANKDEERMSCPSATDADNSTRDPVEQIKNLDPAFRVKLFEFLTYSWPLVKRDDELNPRLLLIKPVLVKYFSTVAITEVWSIRRVALSALGALYNASSTKEEVTDLVRIIGECLNERKSLQVRKSALECLLAILKTGNVDFLQELKLDIRKILILGTSDSQMEVAGTASKVQVIFTELLQ